MPTYNVSIKASYYDDLEIEADDVDAMKITKPPLTVKREYDALINAGTFSYRLTKDKDNDKAVLQIKTGSKMDIKLSMNQNHLICLVKLIDDFFESEGI